MARDWSKQPNFEDVVVGQEIPEVVMPLTLQRLVMEAATNRDFVPIHFDRAAAQAGGAPDAFANTLFIQMLIEITLRYWMGLAGRLKRLGFRMFTFTHAGMVVHSKGRVTGKRQEDGQGLVDLDVWYEAERDGEMVTTVKGTATVVLPLAGG